MSRLKFSFLIDTFFLEHSVNSGKKCGTVMCKALTLGIAAAGAMGKSIGSTAASPIARK